MFYTSQSRRGWYQSCTARFRPSRQLISRTQGHYHLFHYIIFILTCSFIDLGRVSNHFFISNFLPPTACLGCFHYVISKTYYFIVIFYCVFEFFIYLLNVIDMIITIVRSVTFFNIYIRCNATTKKFILLDSVVTNITVSSSFNFVVIL